MKILLAEDSGIGLTIATAMLQGLGHQVHGVTDGLAAVAAAQDDSFDFVLLDLNLPGCDGLTVARQIRAYCVQSDVTAPVILAVSADEPPWLATELAAGSFNGFLPKPLRPAVLREVLGA